MYKNMSEILKDGKCGNFKLSHFKVTENDFYATVRCGIPTGTYIKLTNGIECVMSNTPMEERTNSDFVCSAHGKVLIGGLGIGMILLAIQDREEIAEITVIEKNKEVIDLVGSQLPLNSKVKIVNADVFDYVPETKYNTIYMDIWNTINTEIYEEQMFPLIEKYKQYLVPESEDDDTFIDCWCSFEAENGIRI